LIYLVRHGRTQFNAEQRFQGSLDSPLTTIGIAQAKAQGRLLRRLIPEGNACPIVSSPLGRARATATLIAEAMGDAAIAFDSRLAEVSLGEWEGLTPAEIDLRWPGMRHPSARTTWANGCPGSEPYEKAIARAREWLDAHAGRTLIAVSHGITGSILRGLHAGLGREAMLALPIPQDAVFALGDGGIERFDCDELV
jgi:probable phosphoglycerate mutase